jgi:hypothetical protein
MTGLNEKDHKVKCIEGIILLLDRNKYEKKDITVLEDALHSIGFMYSTQANITILREILEAMSFLERNLKALKESQKESLHYIEAGKALEHVAKFMGSKSK